MERSDLLGAVSSSAAIKRSPVVQGAPLVGILPHLFRNGAQFLERSARANHGEITILKVGFTDVYLITSPEHVKHVLQENGRNYSKGPMWEPMRRVFGDGLGMSEGSTWLRSRRMVQPLFSKKNIDSLVGTIIEAISPHIARLAKIVGSGMTIDTNVEMMNISQDVVVTAIFGADIPGGRTKVIADSINRILASNYLDVMVGLVLPDWCPRPGEIALRGCREVLDETILDLIRQRRQRGDGGIDILSRFLGARDERDAGMEDRQIRDELVTLYVAGLETTARSLTWLWYCLDKHPEVDRRLRMEIDSVLGNAVMNAPLLERLVYTTMVLQESMRFLPTAWIIPRYSLADDVIDGYRIPARSMILLSPYTTHRDPRFWERPDSFYPEHFAPERVAVRPRFAYYPFGGGARQCIGQYFAMVEQLLITAMMVEVCRPRLAPGTSVNIQSSFFLHPRDALRMTLERP
jgi:cytochrome P450